MSMHRILLREVVIDAPTEIFAAERDFWAAALLTQARQVERYPEFTALVGPRRSVHLAGSLGEVGGLGGHHADD